MRRFFGIALLVVVIFSSVAFAEGAIKDTESASHGDSAAWCEPVNTYEGTGFKVLQFNLAVLSHYSYLLMSGKEALVVDPGRDIDSYLAVAKKEGVEIKGVFLTHSHADFVAGHLEMAKSAGCPVFFSNKTKPLYPFTAIGEGSIIPVGNAAVRILETPGHTPDGLCGIVSGRDTPDKPEMAFTGDTLFVGSVGRPDLMGGTTSAAELAAMMFDSWNGKLAKLPDALIVLPAHGAGSLCGAHLSDDPSSTIGRERTSNAYLAYANNRAAFISAVLDGLPEAPQYFQHNARLNHDGPELIDWEAPVSMVATPSTEMTDPAKWYVVDLRSAKEFAGGHVPNGVNIALRGRLETWVGIMVPWRANVLLCGNPAEIKEAAHRLHRVGYRSQGLVWDTWAGAGLPKFQNAMLSPLDLHEQMKKGAAPIVVDVRLPTEWMGLRIGQVLNLPLSHLESLARTKLNPADPVVAVCNSAYRSSLAVGILERAGFTKATSMDGGSEAWIEAGLPVITAEQPVGTAQPGGPSSPLRQINLPDRIAPAELKRLAMDLPGTFQLIDIRPAAQVADYNPLGAAAVDVVEVLSNPSFQAGNIPLIIVDRDGSLAMMVAGILSQKTPRPIKALHGGMEAYWAESELSLSRPLPGTAGKPTFSPTPATSPSQPGVRQPGPVFPVPETTSPAAPAAPTPAKPKKKSAGC